MSNMKRIAWLSSLAMLFVLVSTTAIADKKLAVDKVKGDLSVMVLGSGGPIATEFGRASASYLVFVDGQPKILMDAGGGAFQRLAASGADIKDLDIILLSHLHIDHMGDLSPMVKTMYFHNRRFNVANPGTFPPGRTAPFRVFGPGENGAKFPPVLAADPDTTQYPASTDFVDSHFDLNTGNERYLNIFTRAISAGIFGYSTADVSPDWQNYNPETIIDEDGLVITAVGVNHGPVPALAFRISYKGKSIVYSGDTSSVGSNMISISEDADLLIYDTALGTDTPPSDMFNIFYALHTTPSRIGVVARDAGVKKLILSHITPQTEGKFRTLKSMIRDQGYTGRVKMASDLDVYNLSHH
jgi:ribonuclease BN (tRNA processing enzyme)